jgi:hypothetical protein
MLIKMNNWRSIKRQAEAAKYACTRFSDVELKFKPLLEERGDDPMIYFIRGDSL